MLRLEASLSDEWLTEMLQEDGEDVSPAAIVNLRSKILKDPPRLVANKGKMIQDSLDTGMHELLPHVYRRSWRVLKFAEPCLLTSDNPIGYWAPAHLQQHAPFGIGNAPVAFFPLDRQTALSMTLSRTVEKVVNSGPTRAQQVNYSVAVEAEKWIIYHPDDTPLTGINLPPCGRFVNEYVSNRIAADGSYRELYQMIRR